MIKHTLMSIYFLSHLQLILWWHFFSQENLNESGLMLVLTFGANLLPIKHYQCVKQTRKPPQWKIYSNCKHAYHMIVSFSNFLPIKQVDPFLKFNPVLLLLRAAKRDYFFMMSSSVKITRSAFLFIRKLHNVVHCAFIFLLSNALWPFLFRKLEIGKFKLQVSFSLGSFVSDENVWNALSFSFTY